jgi:transmembrane sensor
MNEIYDNIEDLLGKSLAKETTAEEEQAVETWRRASPDNEQYFKEFQWLWENVPQSRATKAVDTEGALEKVHQQMDAAPALKVVKSPANIFKLSFLMKVAAVLFLGVLIYNPFSKPEPLPVIAARGTPKTDTLMDGSVVTLNKKSSLTLSERFNKKERRMKLTGEAYFEVAHDANRPFVVEVQDLEVQAVGTAFNIDNVTDTRFLSVMVTHGKVKIKSRTETQYAERGETALYDSQTGHITVEKKAENNKIAYKTRQFRFDETPLSIAVAELSKAYGVNIILKNKQLGQCSVVISFDNKPLEDILEILRRSCSFTVEKVGEEYVLNSLNE